MGHLSKKLWDLRLSLSLLATHLSLMAAHPASALAENPPALKQQVLQADTILSATITSYTRDPNDKIDLGKPGTIILGGKEVPIYTSAGAVEAVTTLKMRGHYKFKPLQFFKGEAIADLQLDLPRITWPRYGETDSLRIGEGDTVLLFLKKQAAGGLKPVDTDVPFYVLSQRDKQINLDYLEDGSIDDKVMRLLISSLADPVLRQVNTNLLRKTQNASLISQLVPYLNDPNPRVRDNVLFGMAVNQQVAAIPRIAQLVREQAVQRSGVQAALALQNYKTPEATPYLNPMLFETDQYVRLNSLIALINIADQTSIPYFLLAVRDPDWQDMVAPGSAGMLHKLIPELGPYPSQEEFLKKRQEWIARYQAWWRDELSGKHPPKVKAGKTLAAPKTMPDLAKLKPEEARPLLHSLLFEPSLKTRQAAITALEKVADRSSIPYLLIAAQDPDGTVAYSAYKKLFRLVDGLGLGQNRQAFEAGRDAATKPLYDWWKDELLGKHLRKPQPGAALPRAN